MSRVIHGKKIRQRPLLLVLPRSLWQSRIRQHFISDVIHRPMTGSPRLRVLPAISWIIFGVIPIRRHRRIPRKVPNPFTTRVLPVGEFRPRTHGQGLLRQEAILLLLRSSMSAVLSTSVGLFIPAVRKAEALHFILLPAIAATVLASSAVSAPAATIGRPRRTRPAAATQAACTSVRAMCARCTATTGRTASRCVVSKNNEASELLRDERIRLIRLFAGALRRSRLIPAVRRADYFEN